MFSGRQSYPEDKDAPTGGEQLLCLRCLLAQQLRRLGDVGGDAPGLVGG